MTKSTITREQLLEIIETDHVQCGEASHLACMALAAMDSEPVKRVNADQMHHVCLEANRHLDKYGAMAKEVNKLLGRIPAHPAPVVPEEATPDSIEILASARLRDHAVFQWDEDQRNAAADSWNAFRAAMLQAVPLTNEGDIQAGKSPAQSGCCPAQSPIDHGYRPECECSGCKATARICAELSANSSANPDCWCRTCRPVVLNDMRFVMCPDCGNKRCPRANDHRNACTGSNEPGQEGSAYPDTPREVK